MKVIELFERYAKEYDEWFEKYDKVYKSELHAVKKLIGKGIGLEIGAGTGRFGVPLGVKYGVEPAYNMAKVAYKRGMKICIAKGENLPFKNSTFDFVLIIVTVCFVKQPESLIKEAKRVLKDDGKIIIGFIDKESFLGKFYSRKKSKFYKYAKFYSTEEVIEMLSKFDFCDFEFYQTIFDLPQNIKEVEPVKKGYGEGGFVVIAATNKYDR